MKRLPLLALLLLLAALSAQAQSGFTTVTATVKDPSGNIYVNGRGNAAFVPAPTATTVPLLSGSTFQTDVQIPQIDSFGNFTLVLADNNQVSDGHSGQASQWSFHICSSNTPAICFSTNITITGATQNITAALQAAAAPLPVTAQPAGLTTNNFFTGLNDFAHLGNRRIVCKHDGTSAGWTGADVSVWITNAIADIVANSAGLGTVDAQDCVGAQTISQEIDVGNNAATTHIALLMPPAGTWTISITNGTSCAIKQFSQTAIIGTGNVINPLVIIGSASANLNSFYCTDPSPVGGGSYVRFDGGVQLYNPNGSTVSTALMNVQKVFDNSVFRGITIANYSATDGLLVYSACCGTSFYNITANGNNTGGNQVHVFADTSTRNSDISFYSLSADHPGSGFSSVLINGGATTPTDAVNLNINFYGLYTEDTTTNPDTMLKIVDARGVNVYGWMVLASATPSASFVGLDISQTASNQVRNIDVFGYKYQAGGGTGINNHITGNTFLTSTRYQPHYLFGGSSSVQNSAPTTIEDNAWTLLNPSAFSNTTQNLNFTSNINGCNIASLFNAQHGAAGNQYDTEAVTGCIVNPGTSTAGALAVSGYVQNSAASAGGVPVYGQATCIVASSICWGANFLNADVPAVAVNLNGVESDVNVNNVGTFGQAYDCNGSWSVSATLVDCFVVVKPGGTGATRFWRNGINFFTGATNAPSPNSAGILFNPAASGTSQASQGYTMISNDPVSGTHSAVVNEDTNGNLNFSVNAKNTQFTVNGMLLMPPILFANLGTPGNGTFAFCSDCTIANPCASGGSGAFAKRLNGVWVCN